MNEYEARKQARIERYQKRADAADQEAELRWHSPANETLRSMGGEPIKIGHYSEGHHRRLIAKAHRDCDKACEAMDRAKHYRQRAEAAKANTAISVDDPEAIDKLREKLAALEARQVRLKSDNAALRKAKIGPDTPDLAQALIHAGCSVRGAQSIAQLAQICRFQVTPYCRHPAYELTNNNANLKRVKQRIAELEVHQQAEPSEDIEGPGFRISEDTDWGRILIQFSAGKPPEAVRQLLKRNGWRWAPSRSAWVRHLNNSGQATVQWMVPQLSELMKGIT